MGDGDGAFFDLLFGMFGGAGADGEVEADLLWHFDVLGDLVVEHV